MTPQNTESHGPGGPDRPPSGDMPRRGDAGQSGTPLSLLVMTAIGLLLVGVMSAFVIVVNFLPEPRETGSEPAHGEAAIDDARSEIRRLNGVVASMRIEMQDLKDRLREMEPAHASALAEDLLSPDPARSGKAAGEFSARAGAAGAALVAKILALKGSEASARAALALEAGKSDAALAALVDERRRAAADLARRESQRSTEFYEFGLSAQSEGHFDLAEQYYTKALEIDPAQAASLNGRGSARVAQGRVEEALSDFTKAVTLRPDFHQFRLNRGKALAALGRNAEAAREFEKVLSAQPGNSEARAALTALQR